MASIALVVILVCMAILSVIGTLYVSIHGIKEIDDCILDILNKRREWKQVIESDGFYYKDLNQAIQICSDKANNSYLSSEVQSDYLRLKKWLIELRDIKDKYENQ